MSGLAFGQVLRAYRERSLLTQQQLARRSGISVRTIRELERGRVQRPRGQSVRLLADALGVDDQAREELYAAALGPGQAGPVEGIGESASGTRDAAVDGGAAPFLLPPDVADFTGRDVVATSTWSEALGLFRQFELPQPAALTRRLAEPSGGVSRETRARPG